MGTGIHGDSGRKVEIMKDIIVIGDLHVTKETLPAVQKLFNSDLLKSKGTIFLGDIFHSLERRVDAVLLLELQKCFNKIPDDNYAWSLVGNHDMLYGDYSKIDLLPKVTSVREPVAVTINNHCTFVFIPWMKSEAFSDLAEPFLELIKSPNTVVFSHLPLENSELARFGNSISLEYFNGAAMVFNGHWHKHGVSRVGDTPIINVGSYVPMSTTEIKSYIPSFPTFSVKDTIKDTTTSLRLNNKGDFFTPVHVHRTNTFNSAYNRSDCIVVLTTDDPKLVKQYNKTLRVVTPKIEKMQLAIEVSEKVKSMDKCQLIATLLNEYLSSDKIGDDVGTVLELLLPQEFGGAGTTIEDMNTLLNNMIENLKINIEDIFNWEMMTND